MVRAGGTVHPPIVPPVMHPGPLSASPLRAPPPARGRDRDATTTAHRMHPMGRTRQWYRLPNGLKALYCTRPFLTACS